MAEKHESTPATQSQSISPGMRALITSIGKGTTVEQRNQMQLRGLTQAFKNANDPEVFWTELTNATPALSSAVAGSAGGAQAQGGEKSTGAGRTGGAGGGT